MSETRPKYTRKTTYRAIIFMLTDEAATWIDDQPQSRAECFTFLQNGHDHNALERANLPLSSSMQKVQISIRTEVFKTAHKKSKALNIPFKMFLNFLIHHYCL